MPLPANTTLAIQGQTAYLTPLPQPKQAYLIRLPAGALEALEDFQNQPKVEVDFAERKPGLHIAGQFYPCAHAREDIPHELYLRLASQNKPNAPLKLYANVVGKFTAKELPRELDESVHERVRKSTQDAERVRTQRQTIMLSAPPADVSKPSKSKTKKDATVARRPAANVASSSTAPSTKPPPPPPPAKPSPPPPIPTNVQVDLSSTRSHLIHCLAIQPRTPDQILKACPSTPKSELNTIMKEIAEVVPVAKNSETTEPKRYKLKLKFWLEVRPKQWAPWKVEERRQMCRQCRMAYRDLGVPESDPIWEHASFKSSDAEAAGSSAPTQRNGVLSAGANKKTKGEGARKKAPADIVVPSKNESRKGKGRERERDLEDDVSSVGTPTSATRPSARRLPGSGFKAKQSATPPISDSRSNSPNPPPVRKGPVDVRKRDLPAPSPPAKPQPPIPPPQPSRASTSVAAAAAAIRKKNAGDVPSTTTQRGNEDKKDVKRRDRNSEIPDEKSRISKGRESPIPAAPPLPSFKRKKPPQDGNDSEFSERDVPLSTSSPKKRKLNDPPPSASERAQARDLSLPKKPVMSPVPPRPPPREIKKESSPSVAAFSPPRSSAIRSPLPPRPPTVDRRASTPVMSNGKGATPASKVEPRGSPSIPSRASSSKLRRKSPIYTSSEDESGETPPTRSRVAAPTNSSASDDTQPPPAKRHKAATYVPAFTPRRTLPDDRPGLRMYYSDCAAVHLRLHERQERVRTRIKRLLSRRDGGHGTDGEDGDDGDTDELMPEVLEGFMEEYERVREEMRKVRDKWERLGGRADDLK